MTLDAKREESFAVAHSHIHSREAILCLALLGLGSVLAASPAGAQECGRTTAKSPAVGITAGCDPGVKIESASQSALFEPREEWATMGSGAPHADNDSGGSTKYEPAEKKLRFPKPDFNRDIYYRNKLEFSLDGGWLPINVPFPFDVFEGDPYDLYPLRYTLVPIIGSLRWHLGNVWGPPVIRGNWDVTFSGAYTAIPRGAETRYFSYDMGLRRNFIPRNWHATPYWDVRAGLGFINAKGPLGVYYAQGQNFTFNINMGAGVRYNLSPGYAFSAGLNWMHISNGNLSAPKYSNYGINVYGPMVGIDIQVRRHRRNPDRE
jgi:hypothetical protein